MDMLDKHKKLVCRTADSSLATSLEPLAHCQNVASLSFIGIILVNNYELAELVLIPDYCGSYTCYSNIFINVCRCCKDVLLDSLTL